MEGFLLNDDQSAILVLVASAIATTTSPNHNARAAHRKSALLLECCGSRNGFTTAKPLGSMRDDEIITLAREGVFSVPALPYVPDRSERLDLCLVVICQRVLTTGWYGRGES